MSILDLVMCDEESDVIVRSHGAAVTVGKPVFVAGLGALVPKVSAASGNVAFYRRGVFLATIASAVSISQGDPIWYNTASDKVVKVKPAAGFYLGTAVKDGTATAGYVEVSLNSLQRFSDLNIALTSETDGGDTAYAITAAAVAGRWVYGAVGQARTYTLPSAAAILALFPSAKVGDSVPFTICNTATGNYTITLAVDSGATITNKGVAGHLAIAQNTVRSYLVRFTSITSGAETADLLPV